jgi:hypothetical protein
VPGAGPECARCVKGECPRERAVLVIDNLLVAGEVALPVGAEATALGGVDRVGPRA